jgi:hypothetical protein
MCGRDSVNGKMLSRNVTVYGRLDLKVSIMNRYPFWSQIVDSYRSTPAISIMYELSREMSNV